LFARRKDTVMNATRYEPDGDAQPPSERSAAPAEQGDHAERQNPAERKKDDDQDDEPGYGHGV
jgi:hypothetical protein